MFFMMGITGGRKDLNFNQTMICSRCGQYGSYSVFMTYTVLSLFFIPVFKWNKRYYVTSSCCKSVYSLDPEKGRMIEKGVRVDISPNDLTFVSGSGSQTDQSSTELPWYLGTHESKNSRSQAGSSDDLLRTKRCPKCGYQAQADFDYCPKCGSRLE